MQLLRELLAITFPMKIGQCFDLTSGIL